MLSGRGRRGMIEGMNGANERKVLIRPHQGRMVAGVCAGIGDYFGVDANIIRVVFAVLTVFSLGAAALVYVVAWAVVPEEGESKSIAESYLDKTKKPGSGPS
jgi:phage shock protein PspC (stress-responsive transcriptional regulator)